MFPLFASLPPPPHLLEPPVIETYKSTAIEQVFPLVGLNMRKKWVAVIPRRQEEMEWLWYLKKAQS